MKSRRLTTALVVVLLIAAGALAYGVDRRMNTSSVTAQTIDPTPSVEASATDSVNAEAPVAVFIGDFTSGTDQGGMGDKNWTSILVANASRAMELRAVVVGEGSGYVVRSAAPTFADQVRRFVSPEDRVVVISGSRNDIIADPKEVTAAAIETFNLVHTLAPAANLVVVGPTFGTVEPTEQVLATRDAVLQAAQAAGANFIDPIELKWFTTGEPGLIGADNVHPTDLANERMAEYMMPVFSRALLEKNTR